MTARRDYHHGDLRRALLDAALALFAERGRFDFTMRELARAAGVTHNAPYRHFEDRWALLDALAAEGFERLRKRCLAPASRQAQGARDPRARVVKMGMAYVGFAADHPNHFRLMFLRPLEGSSKRSGAASPELVKAALASFAVLQEAIADAAAGGHLRTGLSQEDVTLTAWSLVHGIASLVVGGQLRKRAVTARIASLADIFAGGAFARGKR